MSARPSGLGRGLGELFQRTDTPQTADVQETTNQSAEMPDGSYYAEIPVELVSPNPQQPRQVFDPDELAELADSIREIGLLQPVVVRPAGDRYELIMGERRWRAHQLAGIKTIPTIVRATDDAALLRDALLENLHRVQLNPLEEAAAYRQLLDDFACTKEELASRIKRSRPHISNTLRLLTLPAAVQRRVAAGVLSAGHARALLSLADPLAQEQLAQRVVAEGLSVRGTEEAVTLALRSDRQEFKQRAQRTKDLPEHLEHHLNLLSDRLDTRVQISLGRKRGKLTIEFADTDDFDRIMAILARND